MGEDAGGGEVKGAGAGCCGPCVDGYVEKLPHPQLLPGALIVEDLWMFPRSRASVVEFQVFIPGTQQPTMQACLGSLQSSRCGLVGSHPWSVCPVAFQGDAERPRATGQCCYKLPCEEDSSPIF